MTIHLQTGDTVQYNGKEAKITSSDSGSSFVWINVGGEDKLVNINDLKTYGIFSNGLSDEDKEKLAENKQKIKGYKQDWSIGRDLKWDAIRCLSSFWRNLGISIGSFDKLNSEQLAEYKSYKDQKSAGIAQMLTASSGVHSTVNNSLSILSC